MVDVDDPVLHVEVTDRQPTKLGDTHARMKQDEYCLVVFAVTIIPADEPQKLSHLVPGDCFPSHAIVYHNPCELEAEGVLLQIIVIDSQLEFRPEHAPHRFDAAVPPAVILQFY